MNPKSQREFTIKNNINAALKSFPLFYSLLASSKTIRSSNAITSNEFNQLKGFQTKSGLKYFDIIEGINGTSPKYGQLVSFHYTSYYRPSGNGELDTIDSSYLSNTPFLYKHGNTRIIRGIDESIHTMNLGGRRRVIIPKNLGYIEFGLGPVPSDFFR